MRDAEAAGTVTPARRYAIMLDVNGVPSEQEMKFWDEFNAAVVAAGRLSPVEISRLTDEVIDHPVSASTIRGWLTKDRLPRDDDDFLAVIKVFQAERQHDWLPLLHAAQKGRDGRVADGPSLRSSPPTERVAQTEHATHSPSSSDEPRHVMGKKASRSLMLGGACAIVSLVIIVAFVLSVEAGGGNDPVAAGEGQGLPAGSPRPSAQACADVVKPVAYVFPQPGADPYEKIAKYRGDEVVLYPEVPDAADPNGRRYRAIRSPARANPGRSPYSWMLAEDIADAACKAH